MKTMDVELAQRGQLTLPKVLRDEYRLEPGQHFTLLDLGGAFLFSPHESRVDTLCDELRDGLISEGASLEEMLIELRLRRESHETQ